MTNLRTHPPTPEETALARTVLLHPERANDLEQLCGNRTRAEAIYVIETLRQIRALTHP
jgi:hypothetical protein